MRRTPRLARLIACATLALCPCAAAQTLERFAQPRAQGYVIRPRDRSGPMPVTVFLHGLCGDPASACPRFREGVDDRSWLLCPSAPQRCEGGGASWNPSGLASSASIRRAVDAVDRLAPGEVDRAAPGVLIGFSQGAYIAERVARSAPGRWRGVAFVGAFIHVGRARLEAMGVRRVVLAAGRYDMTRRALEETAQNLAREGFPGRFVDLGAVGHTYVPSRRVAGWRDALAWLEESY